MPLLRLNKNSEDRARIKALHPEIQVQGLRETLQRPDRHTPIQNAPLPENSDVDSLPIPQAGPHRRGDKEGAGPQQEGGSEVDQDNKRTRSVFSEI